MADVASVVSNALIEREDEIDLSDSSLAVLHQVIFDGADFLKFGKRGQPHYRRVWCTSSGSLEWGPIPANPSVPLAPQNSIKLKEVTTVVKGKHSKVFHRQVARGVADHLCFSVVTPQRTLDLQCLTTSVRDLWVEAITSAVLHAKRGVQLAAADGKTSDGDSKAAEAKRSQDMKLVEDLCAAVSEEELGLIQFLDKGELLIKHGRAGQPKAKLVHLNKGKILWSVPSGSGRVTSPPNVQLVRVKKVIAGKGTDVMKRIVAKNIPGNVCFSIVTPERTLDLQCPDEKSRDNWVKAISFAAKKSQEIANKRWLNTQRRQSDTWRKTFTYNEIARKYGFGDTVNQHTARLSSTWGANSVMPRAKAEPAPLRADVSVSVETVADPVPVDLPPEVERIKEDLVKELSGQELSFQEMKMLTFLDVGEELNKFGRKGKPKAKWVNVTKGKIFWGPALLGRTPANSATPSHILLLNVKGVLVGKITKVFGRRVAQSVPGNVCFSVVTDERTLDLQCLNEERRDMWVQAIKFAVKRTKEEVHRQWLARQRLSQLTFRTLDTKSLNQLSNKVRSSSMAHLNGALADLGLGRIHRSNTWSGRDHEALLATKFVLNWIAGSARPGEPHRSPSSSTSLSQDGDDSLEPSMSSFTAIEVISESDQKQPDVVTFEFPNSSSTDQASFSSTGDSPANHHKSGQPGPAQALEMQQPGPFIPKKSTKKGRKTVKGLFEDLNGSESDGDVNSPPSSAESLPQLSSFDNSPHTAGLPSSQRSQSPPALPPRPPPLSSQKLLALARRDTESKESEAGTNDNVSQSLSLSHQGDTESQSGGSDMALSEVQSYDSRTSTVTFETDTDISTDYGDTNYANEDEEDAYEASDRVDTLEDRHTETEEDTMTQSKELSTIEEERTDMETTDAEKTDAEHTQAEETAAEDTAPEDDFETYTGGRKELRTGEMDHETENEEEKNYTEDETTAAEETDADYMDDDQKRPSPATNVVLTDQQVEILLLEVKRCRKVLKNLKANWSVRTKAMNTLETLLTERNLIALPQFWRQMDHITRCLGEQLEDLRSSVVKEACKLLTVFADYLGRCEEFLDTLTYLFPILFRRLYVTIKVISSNCDECVQSVLSRTRAWAPRLIPEILNAAMSDSHGIVRARCTEYLAQILTECRNDCAVDDYILELAGLIGKNINDADKEARTATRKLFLAFEYLWPQAANKLFEKFSGTTQRTINSERRARDNAKRAAKMARSTKA